ncbi:MAG: tRNA-uridine aminocarboxypropyltransferase [Sandaracinaceae bacterium]|nr:tRNA-uridine aminocarboxypropyltransferase [Sandaracinaceae bacterium]
MWPRRLTPVLSMLEELPSCASCARPLPICICDRLPPSPLPSPVEVCILQHPQEQDLVLGTAGILTRSLERTSVRVGLSWPSPEAAVGHSIDRKRWAVLFTTAPLRRALEGKEPGSVVILGRKGRPRPPDAPLLEGIIVLDGSWSQAKSLWWRNGWMLKLNQIGILPREPSIYGRLRREPRREWVSTLEAVADVLPALGGEKYESTRAELRRIMRTMCQRARDAIKALI